jgi:HEAT repeat protein
MARHVPPTGSAGRALSLFPMKKLLILSGLALWVVILALSPAKPDGKEAAPATAAAPHRSAKATRPERDPASRGKAQPAADPARLDEARSVIEAAVVTYEPAGVKAIRPFLLDPDPQIRQAARDGMVQLGESDAVPLLRDAASKLEDPREIASLQEAADLLALPAWSESEEARAVAAEIVGESNR